MSTPSLAEAEYDWSPRTDILEESQRLKGLRMKRASEWSRDVSFYAPSNPFAPLDAQETPSLRTRSEQRSHIFQTNGGQVVVMEPTSAGQQPPQIIVLGSSSSSSGSDDTDNTTRETPPTASTSRYGRSSHRSSRSPKRSSPPLVIQASRDRSPRNRELESSVYPVSARSSAPDRFVVQPPSTRAHLETTKRPPSPAPTIILPYASSQPPRFIQPPGDTPSTSGELRPTLSKTRTSWSKTFKSVFRPGNSESREAESSPIYPATPSGFTSNPVQIHPPQSTLPESPAIPLAYLPLPQPPPTNAFRTDPPTGVSGGGGPGLYHESPPPLFMPPPPPISDTSFSSNQSQYQRNLGSPQAMSIATVSLPGVASPPPSMTYRGYQESLV